MRENKNRSRVHGGFTLSEMAVVITVLAVLAALAVPAVVKYRRELKLTELDDSARSIYMAAQNQLTSLRQASSGESVAKVLGASGTTTYTLGERETTVYYAQNTGSDAVIGILVPSASIEKELESGTYLVEYDPRSGIVYGVFYTEKDNIPYRGDLEILSSRSRAHRMGSMVGYYGVGTGSPDLAGPDVKLLPKAGVKIINAEALVLEISVDADGGTTDAENIGLSVTVGGRKVFASTDTGSALGFSGSVAGGLVVLDAVDIGELHLTGTIWHETKADPAWWAEAQNGEIEAEVTVFYRDTAAGIAALPRTVTVSANALFAGVAPNAAPDTYTAQIACGRHLQNLIRLNEPGADLGAVTAAAQIQDIDFMDKSSRKGVYSWAETYAAAAGSGCMAFAPVDVNSVDPFKTYDGQNCKISNLYITGTGAGGNTGLFGSFAGTGLAGVILVDPVVAGTAASAGALAGSVNGSAVSGCRVYATEGHFLGTNMSRVAGSGASGGLIGAMGGGSVTGCSASLPLVAGTESVGGLIGSAANSQVVKSYADTGVREDGNKDGWADATGLSGATVGGLVGDFTDTGMITNCYSAGYVNSATTAAGGLMAAGSAIFSEKCYAAMDYNDSSSISNTVTIYGAAPSYTGTAPDTLYYLSRGRVTQTGIGTSKSYTELNKLTNIGKTGIWDGAGSAWETAGIATTRPYGLPDGSKYPFPKLEGMNNYGDWCDALEPILAYFEKYSDTDFGFWYWDKMQTKAVSTLRDDRTTPGYGSVVSEGYALLTPDTLGDDAREKWSVETDSGLEVVAGTASTRLVDLSVPAASLPVGMENAYYLPWAALSIDAPAVTGGYYWLEIEDQAEGWFNPHFAKAVYSGYDDVDTLTTAVTTATVNQHIVRSVRHLDNIRKYSGSAQTYTQEISVNGASYKGYQSGTAYAGMEPVKESGITRLQITPITDKDSGAFTGTYKSLYERKDNTIAFLKIEEKSSSDKDPVGLFRQLKKEGATGGLLEGITLTETFVYANGYNQQGIVGVLVGKMESGKISYCDVVWCRVDGGTHLSSGTTGYAGGLVGEAAGGTIEHSAVHLDRYANNNTLGVLNDYSQYYVSGRHYVGGLVGYAHGMTITSCAASVKVGTSVADNAQADGWDIIPDAAGGLVGLVENVTITDSYSGGKTVDKEYTGDACNVQGLAAGGLIGKAGNRLEGKGVTITGYCYSTASTYGKLKAGRYIGDNGDNQTVGNEGLIIGNITFGGDTIYEPDGVPNRKCYVLDNVARKGAEGTYTITELESNESDVVFLGTGVNLVDGVFAAKTARYDLDLPESYVFQNNTTLKDLNGGSNRGECQKHIHYGDWKPLQMRIAYFEMYNNLHQDGTEEHSIFGLYFTEKKAQKDGEGNTIYESVVTDTLRGDATDVGNTTYITLSNVLEGETPQTVLMKDYKAPVTMEGYGIVSAGRMHTNASATGADAETVVPVTISVGGVNKSAKLTYVGKFKEDGRYYYVYALPWSLMDNATPDTDNYYINYEIQGASYIFNPHFAKAAYNGYENVAEVKGLGVPGSNVSNPIPVRSVRQLNNIHKYGSQNYKQEMSLNGAEYNFPSNDYISGEAGKNWRQVIPITGLSNTAFTGTYDGGNQSNGNLSNPVELVKAVYITNLNIGTKNDAPNNVGLFGWLGTSGELKDITMYECTVGSGSQDRQNTGALVGLMENGTVEDCALWACAVTGKTNTQSTGIGGFVGKLENGSISNASFTGTGSALTGTYTSGTKATAKDSNIGVGAVVGTMTGGSLTLKNAPSGVTVIGDGVQGVGGFVGYMTAGTIQSTESGGTSEASTINGGATSYSVGGVVGYMAPEVDDVITTTTVESGSTPPSESQLIYSGMAAPAVGQPGGNTTTETSTDTASGYEKTVTTTTTSWTITGATESGTASTPTLTVTVPEAGGPVNDVTYTGAHALILPAPSSSGQTTLTIALVGEDSAPLTGDITWATGSTAVNLDGSTNATCVVTAVNQTPKDTPVTITAKTTDTEDNEIELATVQIAVARKYTVTKSVTTTTQTDITSFSTYIDLKSAPVDSMAVTGGSDQEGAGYGGLVGHMDGGYIKTGTITSVIVNHSGNENDPAFENTGAGGVIGYMTGGAVESEDGTLKLEKATVTGNGNVGGVVGYLNGGSLVDVKLEQGALIGTNKASAETGVGGIAGRVSGYSYLTGEIGDSGAGAINVTDSGGTGHFVNVHVQGSNNVGGFVGYVDCKYTAPGDPADLSDREKANLELLESGANVRGKMHYGVAVQALARPVAYTGAGGFVGQLCGGKLAGQIGVSGDAAASIDVWGSTVDGDADNSNRGTGGFVGYLRPNEDPCTVVEGEDSHYVWANRIDSVIKPYDGNTVTVKGVSVSGPNNVGGFVGYMNKMTLGAAPNSYCYEVDANSVTSTDWGVAHQDLIRAYGVGGFAGKICCSTIDAKTNPITVKVGKVEALAGDSAGGFVGYLAGTMNETADDHGLMRSQILGNIDITVNEVFAKVQIAGGFVGRIAGATIDGKIGSEADTNAAVDPNACRIVAHVGSVIVDKRDENATWYPNAIAGGFAGNAITDALIEGEYKGHLASTIRYAKVEGLAYDAEGNLMENVGVVVQGNYAGLGGFIGSASGDGYAQTGEGFDEYNNCIEYLKSVYSFTDDQALAVQKGDLIEYCYARVKSVKSVEGYYNTTDNLGFYARGVGGFAGSSPDSNQRTTLNAHGTDNHVNHCSAPGDMTGRRLRWGNFRYCVLEADAVDGLTLTRPDVNSTYTGLFLGEIPNTATVTGCQVRLTNAQVNKVKVVINGDATTAIESVGLEYALNNDVSLGRRLAPTNAGDTTSEPIPNGDKIRVLVDLADLVDGSSLIVYSSAGTSREAEGQAGEAASEAMAHTAGLGGVVSASLMTLSVVSGNRRRCPWRGYVGRRTGKRRLFGKRGGKRVDRSAGSGRLFSISDGKRVEQRKLFDKRRGKRQL